MGTLLRRMLVTVESVSEGKVGGHRGKSQLKNEQILRGDFQTPNPEYQSLMIINAMFPSNPFGTPRPFP